MTEIINASVLV